MSRPHRIRPKLGAAGAALAVLVGTGLGACVPADEALAPYEGARYFDPAATSAPAPRVGGSQGSVPPGRDAAPVSSGSTSVARPEPAVDAAARPIDAAPVSSGADGSPQPPAAVSGSCKVTVDVTTASAGGRYSPRNVGAIWITDANDQYVKTLRIWGLRRRGWLENWYLSSGEDTTDAITGATATTHGTRSATWNCTRFDQKPAGPGSYQVNFEFTDYNGTGPTRAVSFERGATAATVTAPDNANFKAIRVQVTP